MTKLQKALAKIKELQELHAARCRAPRDPSKIGYYIYRRRVAAKLKGIEVHHNTSAVETSGGSCTVRVLKEFADKLGCKAWEIVKEWEDANP